MVLQEKVTTRFVSNFSIKALAPDIKIIAPWRDSKWKLQSREDEIEYCKQHGIDLPFGLIRATAVTVTFGTLA